MPTTVKHVRTYSTKLRRQQADLTRRRVLEAARGLFVEHGFGTVTMQEIAAAAGVAYQTVYAQFGNKLQLAVELCNSELLHVGPAVAMLVGTRSSPDAAAWLRIIGPFTRSLYEPCAPVLRFMRESGDPDLLARYRSIEVARFEQLKPLAAKLERSGRLARGLTGKHAVDIAWTLSGPEMYERLVLDHGWSPETYETWVGAAAVGLLLARP